jgi:glycosyltransferase involved in cell wall biosynthesis
MAVSSKDLSVSVVIPTLNSARVLEPCLRSIRYQNYFQKNLQILIVDGGSVDTTLSIAKSYNCHILNNPFKTAESGKAIGVKKASGKYIILIDSDNILPDPEWLHLMLYPLNDRHIIGTEPWEYTYRPNGGFIERYSALTGVNDPYALIAGNYDRQNILSGKWTGLKLPIKDFPKFQTIKLLPHKLLPTIGANGTIFRRSFLEKYFHGNYLFDIDIISSAIKFSKQSLLFAKVKTGIIHSFCGSSVSKFYLKQYRRATDLYIYRKQRSYSLTQNNLLPSILFTLYVITILPMVFDTIRGLLKKPDPAWLFHPLACLITLYVYSIQTIKYQLGLLKPVNRLHWQQ